MRCEKCHQNEANVQLNIRVNEQAASYRLCDACYQQEKQHIGGMNMNFQPFSFPFDDFMKQLNPQQPWKRAT